MQNQTQTNEEFTPLTKQKLFDGVVLSKLIGTPIAEIEKNFDGYWCKSTYNDVGMMLTYENSNGCWHKYTYNDVGIELTFEDSDGFWRKCTYNDAGQRLTYETSNGYWYKYTYNDVGIELTFEDSYGTFRQYIASDNLYGLYFEKGRYKAGCRDFSYKEAIEHWTERSTNKYKEVSKRAKLFLKAIAEHQQTLHKSNT